MVNGLEIYVNKTIWKWDVESRQFKAENLGEGDAIKIIRSREWPWL